MFRLLFSLVVAAWGGPPEPTAESLLASVRETDFTARIERFSERFLGRPFLDSPLGEGPGGRYDQGPLVRFDGFDCTTFVETVVALALSRTAADLPHWLRHIRYRDGQVDFLSRNHFPCGDWIPNNTSWGLVSDITAEVAGSLGTLEATARESKAGWVAKLPPDAIRVPGLDPAAREARHAELAAKAAALPFQRATVRYIPLAKIIRPRPGAVPEPEPAAPSPTPTPTAEWTDEQRREYFNGRLKDLIRDTEVDAGLLAAVPSGTLLNVIRPHYSVPGTRLLISHQGLVIRKKGRPYFRHVSRSGGGYAKDVLLENYLRLCLFNTAIHGIQILRFNDVRGNRLWELAPPQGKR